MRKLLLVLLIIGLCITPCYGKTPWSSKPPISSQIDWSHPLSHRLVGCWIMNEGAGNVVNDIVNRDKGTNIGATWRPTQKGIGLNFNGSNNYVNFIPNNRFSNLSSGTVSMRLRWTTTPVLNDAVFSYYKDNNNRAAIFFPDVVSGPTIGVEFNIGGVPKTVYDVVAASTYNEKWVNIVLTFGTSLKLYINGVLKNTTVDNSSFAGIGVSTLMGIGTQFYNSAPYASYYDGVIVDTLIYSRALSPSEIRQLYAEPYCFIKPQTAWGKVTAAGGAVLRAIINIF